MVPGSVFSRHSILSPFPKHAASTFLNNTSISAHVNKTITHFVPHIL